MIFRSRRPLLALAVSTALVATAGGAAAAIPSGAPVTSAGADRVAVAQPAKAGVKPSRIVVVISVDGFNPSSIAKLGPDKTKAFHRLMREGATTLNARTSYEMTKTLPNHTGMMTGRRVEGVNGHHVDFNSDNGRTLRSVNGHYVAGIYDGVHDRGMATALYTDKDKFRFFQRSWDKENGARDLIGGNNGRNKLTRFVFDDPGVLTNKLTAQLKSNPDELSFLHLALPDHAGHKYGWMSPQYLTAVHETSLQVGRVLSTIAGDSYLKAHTVVVLTADHGGKPGTKAHGMANLYVDYRIPFMIWGHGVAKGVGLYGINPARKWPGEDRPTYAGKQPIRNIDVAGMVTKLLGLPRVVGGQMAGMAPLNIS